MDRMDEKQLPEKFNSAFMDVPPVPAHLYGAVMRKIVRKRIITRSVWAAAASILIAVTVFTINRPAAPREAFAPEVSDEVSCINSYFNSDDLQDDENAFYENLLYLP